MFAGILRAWCIVVVTAVACEVPALAQSRAAASTAASLQNTHPAEYYRTAARLFGSNQQDDAVFIFYLGQLRYRTHLKARPDLPPSGDPALFASLSEVVGRPINLYAFGDIPALAKTIDEVIAFDRANPDGFTKAADFPQAHAEVRKGLAEMRSTLVADADRIRAERLRNGLKNRN